MSVHNASRVDAIDALRAAAMLGVVAQHCGVFPVGWAGVWLFYVISGYVIARGIDSAEASQQTLGFAQRYGRFMAMRMARIVPALLVYLLVCSVVAASFGIGDFFPHLPYLAGFIFNWRMIGLDWSQIGMWGPIGHLWTISVEQQFYLLFPLLAMLAPRGWRVRLCVAIIVVTPLIRATASAWLASSGGTPLDHAFAIYASTYGHVDAFLVGALIAYRQEWLAADSRRMLLLAWAACVLTVFYFIAYLCVNVAHGARGVSALRNIFSGILWGQGREVFVYVAVVGLAAWWVAWAITAPAHASKTRASINGRAHELILGVLAWVGRISYGGYLVHALVIWSIETLSGKEVLKQFGMGGRLGFFLLVTLVTLLLAHLMYRFVEQPVLRWSKRRLIVDSAKPEGDRRDIR